MADGNHGCGIAQQIEPFGITPGIKILDGLALNRPTAFPVAEGGNRRRRTQQNGGLSHLRQKLCAQHVTANPGFEYPLLRERRFGRGPLEELLQHWAQLVLTSVEHWANQHSAGRDEKLPPQHARFFQTFWSERLDVKSRTPQGSRSSPDGGASLGSDRRAAIILKVTHSQLLDISVARPAQRNRRGASVAIVRTLHHFEQSPHISHGPCHGPNHANQRERSARRGKVTGGRNAARRRLEPADAAEMCRHSNRSTAVTADAARRHPGYNRRRLAAAGAARGAFEIPWAVGAAVQQVVRLPRHQQFRRIRDSENDRSRLAQARHQRSVFGRNVSSAQAGARFASQSRHVQRTFNADGNAVQRAKRFAAQHRSFGVTGFAPNTFGVDVHERVQFWVEPRDPQEMSLRQFDRRDLLLADLQRHLHGRKEGQFAHEILARIARSSMRFSSFVSSRKSPLASWPKCSGPTATRASRSTSAPSASTMRRICRFFPSSRMISSQQFFSPARSRRACVARRSSPPSTRTPLTIACANFSSTTLSICTW